MGEYRISEGGRADVQRRREEGGGRRRGEGGVGGSFGRDRLKKKMERTRFVFRYV